ncbi:hypothetical protein EVAR_21231_1 [Eumeta japonica]|uniref:Uncharacterized protein n=1 Tax=Eumeta variegata TaxID=151549 RepID=A0A4C1UP48_EUMVA|nr:hypothetical protein EVAR_21231_1 [Eumeta japonica]
MRTRHKLPEKKMERRLQPEHIPNINTRAEKRAISPRIQRKRDCARPAVYWNKSLVSIEAGRDVSRRNLATET